MKNQIITTLMLYIWILAGCNGGPLGKEIVISEAKVQKQIAEQFPYTKKLMGGLATLELINPKVTLEEDKILVSADLNANALTFETEGDAKLSGKVHYKPEDKAFYLHDFEVLDLNLDDTDLKGAIKRTLVDGVNVAASEYLEDIPIYSLESAENQNWKLSLGKKLLKEVKTRKGELVLVLGLN